MIRKGATFSLVLVSCLAIALQAGSALALEPVRLLSHNFVPVKSLTDTASINIALPSGDGANGLVFAEVVNNGAVSSRRIGRNKLLRATIHDEQVTLDASREIVLWDSKFNAKDLHILYSAIDHALMPSRLKLASVRNAKLSTQDIGSNVSDATLGLHDNELIVVSLTRSNEGVVMKSTNVQNPSDVRITRIPENGVCWMVQADTDIICLAFVAGQDGVKLYNFSGKATEVPGFRAIGVVRHLGDFSESVLGTFRRGYATFHFSASTQIIKKSFYRFQNESKADHTQFLGGAVVSEKSLVVAIPGTANTPAFRQLDQTTDSEPTEFKLTQAFSGLPEIEFRRFNKETILYSARHNSFGFID